LRSTMNFIQIINAAITREKKCKREEIKNRHRSFKI